MAAPAVRAARRRRRRRRPAARRAADGAAQPAAVADPNDEMDDLEEDSLAGGLKRASPSDAGGAGDRGRRIVARTDATPMAEAAVAAGAGPGLPGPAAAPSPGCVVPSATGAGLVCPHVPREQFAAFAARLGVSPDAEPRAFVQAANGRLGDLSEEDMKLLVYDLAAAASHDCG